MYPKCKKHRIARLIDCDALVEFVSNLQEGKTSAQAWVHEGQRESKHACVHYLYSDAKKHVRVFACTIFTGAYLALEPLHTFCVKQSNTSHRSPEFESIIPFAGPAHIPHQDVDKQGDTRLISTVSTESPPCETSRILCCDWPCENSSSLRADIQSPEVSCAQHPQAPPCRIIRLIIMSSLDLPHHHTSPHPKSLRSIVHKKHTTNCTDHLYNDKLVITTPKNCSSYHLQPFVQESTIWFYIIHTHTHTHYPLHHPASCHPQIPNLSFPSSRKHTLGNAQTMHQHEQ